MWIKRPIFATSSVREGSKQMSKFSRKFCLFNILPQCRYCSSLVKIFESQKIFSYAFWIPLKHPSGFTTTGNWIRQNGSRRRVRIKVACISWYHESQYFIIRRTGVRSESISYQIFYWWSLETRFTLKCNLDIVPQPSLFFIFWAVLGAYLIWWKMKAWFLRYCHLSTIFMFLTKSFGRSFEILQQYPL